MLQRLLEATPTNSLVGIKWKMSNFVFGSIISSKTFFCHVLPLVMKVDTPSFSKLEFKRKTVDMKRSNKFSKLKLSVLELQVGITVLLKLLRYTYGNHHNCQLMTTRLQSS